MEFHDFVSGRHLQTRPIKGRMYMSQTRKIPSHTMGLLFKGFLYKFVEILKPTGYLKLLVQTSKDEF